MYALLRSLKGMTKFMYLISQIVFQKSIVYSFFKFDIHPISIKSIADYSTTRYYLIDSITSRCINSINQQRAKSSTFLVLSEVIR